jgi:putative inorganic carbon (HCO3(-)) transporter
MSMPPIQATTQWEGRLFIGLLVLLVWVPLPFGSDRPWAAAILEVAVMGVMLFWLWGYAHGRVSVGPVLRRARWALYPLIIYLVYALLQFTPLPLALVARLSPQSAALHESVQHSYWATLSVDPYASQMTWFKSLSYVLVFTLTLLLINTHARVKTLALTLVYSGMLQGFFGALMTLTHAEYGFFIKKFAYVGFATGTFVNRNHLAGYLELTLAVGIGLLISSLSGERARSWRQWLRNFLALLLGPKLRLRLMLAMMVIALVLTRSRMGNTAFFAGLMVAGVAGLILSRHATRSTVILLASLVIIDLFIVGAWFGVEKVVARLESTSTVNDADRLSVSRDGLKLWQDYAIIGSGAGSFYSVYPGYRSSDVGNYYDHAHNDYVELAAENGVMGAGLLILTVASSFMAALVAQYRRHDPLMRGMSFAALMGIAALMIHSAVDFNLQIPANALTFMVLLALAWIALASPTCADWRRQS